MQLIGGGLTVYRACVCLMTSAVTSCALALLILHLHYSATILVTSASKPRRHSNTDSHSALYTMYLPERCIASSLTGFNKGVIISQRGAEYAPDTRCTLHLRVRSSARAIRFTFEHMDLPEVRPGHCEDYVQFYTPSPDVSDPEDIVAGPFCGQTLPQDFFSNGTSVLVRFTSNSKRQRSGFRFRFERISYSVDLCGSSSDCSDVTAQHGVEIDSSVWRSCCYILVIIVGVYATWQYPSTLRYFCTVILARRRLPSTGILPR